MRIDKQTVDKKHGVLPNDAMPDWPKGIETGCGLQHDGRFEWIPCKATDQPARGHGSAGGIK